MVTAITNFIVWFLVWVGLSWPVTVKEIVVGILVSAFVTYMTIDVFKRQGDTTYRIGDIITLPVKAFWFVVYAVVFIWECLRANIDVAFRVLHPDVPIRPGTVRVKTALRSDAGITFLANSITLTPGTTTVDVDKEKGYVYIHQLSIREGTDSLPVVGRFEWILKRIFE